MTDKINAVRNTLKERRDASGRVLGRVNEFRLIRKLGKGGLGVVYLAEDEFGEYAVKSVRDAREIERLKKTYKKISGLKHENIAVIKLLQKVQNVDYFDDATQAGFGVVNGDYVLLMQYAKGETLRSFRKRFENGIVPIDIAIAICRFLAGAIDYVHSKNVVHCDVKPSNIMIETDASGNVKNVLLIDFGLACVCDESSSSSGRGLFGTPGYMAPEQWASDGKISPATDQYALAVVLYEMLFSKIPFEDILKECNNKKDNSAMSSAVQYRSRSAIPFLGLAYSQARALRKALSKKSGDRYESCTDFINAFSLQSASVVEKAKFGAMVWADSIIGSVAKITRRGGDVIGDVKSKLCEIKAKVTVVARHQSSVAHEKIELGNGKQIEVVTIPPTTFTMGSPGSEIGRQPSEKRHEVTLTEPFRIAVTPVKQSTWRFIMGNSPSRFNHGGEYPVENVSRGDCLEFIAKLNRDYPVDGWRWALPTDAQWECACRAGETGPFSGTRNIDDMGWYAGNSEGETHPVALKSSNAFGIYDMHGNVWEWCLDGWRDRLPLTPQTDPLYAEQGNGLFVCRGGSWNNGEFLCRSACRRGFASSSHFDNIGFRLAMIKEK